MKQIINTISRNEYGQVVEFGTHFSKAYTPYIADIIAEARCMIGAAVKTKKIDRAYDNISWDRKKRAEGDALHHEIYDISDDGRHTLVCLRSTQGNGKYGVSTTSKRYFILSAHGKGVKVVEAPKSKAAKAAKQAKTPGEAIMVCLGKKKLSVPGLEKTTCYKIVAIENGEFASVYDDSPWNLNKTRTEKSTLDHNGGYYVFPSIESAMTAWTERLAFREDWMTADRYALLECECSGRAYQHNNDKICISRVKPVAQIATFI